MAGGYQAQPSDGYDALARKIADLQRQLNALRNQAPVGDSAISNGGNLVVFDEDGNQVVKLGHDTAGFRGASFTTPDGIDMLHFGISVVTPGQAILTMNDADGNTAFAPDVAGDGTGIFWPFVPIKMAPMVIALWPGNTTGSFVTVSQGGSEHYAQGLYVAARAVCDGGATAGQARLLCDGSQVGSTVAVTTSPNTVEFRGVAGGAIRSNAFIEVQTRVTAGAGTCRAQVYDAEWVPFALTV